MVSGRKKIKNRESTEYKDLDKRIKEKTKDGTVLVEIDEIFGRWTEYISESFDDVRIDLPRVTESVKGPKILPSEIMEALRRVKINKAAGPDGIVMEMIEALGDYGIEKLTEVVNKIYDDGVFSDELSKSIFIALPQKTGAVECELHRTISLMSHITKIILRVLLLRARNRLSPEIGKMQFGSSEMQIASCRFVRKALCDRHIEQKFEGSALTKA
ncbi:uncharacterized protein LOC134765778 [Penaeus indicus]|uniref:uncharacterized protein LOC134765778 n=1 Tax=Penaeus indicus TaxID=29960 RepID=UPI00300D8CF6